MKGKISHTKKKKTAMVHSLMIHLEAVQQSPKCQMTQSIYTVKKVVPQKLILSCLNVKSHFIL